MFQAQPNSVHESFSPFSYLNLFFCLTRTDKIGSAYRSHPWFVALFIVNMILLPVSGALYWLTYEHSSLAGSGVYYWCFRLLNWGILLRLVFLYFIRLLTHKKEMRLYAAVDDFDKQMMALGKGREIAEANRALLRFNLYAMPMTVAGYLLAEFDLSAIAGHNISWLLILSRLVGTYVGILAKFQFYMWCTAIRDRFIMVNDLMLKVKEKFQLNNMFVVSVYKYEQCIEKYADLHRDLTHVARKMNGIYQFDLLWHFYIMFIVIFTNTYYSAYTVLRNKDASLPVAFILNLAYILFEIMLSIMSSTNLCNESYKALDIFNNLKVDPDDSSTQRLVISSIFEFKENHLEITACRFFNVNFSTLAVMTTIIVNYVFIMIQFEEPTSTGGANSTTLPLLSTTALTPYAVAS